MSIWSEEACEKLRVRFECTDWSVFHDEEVLPYQWKVDGTIKWFNQNHLNSNVSTTKEVKLNFRGA